MTFSVYSPRRLLDDADFLVGQAASHLCYVILTRCT